MTRRETVTRHGRRDFIRNTVWTGLGIGFLGPRVLRAQQLPPCPILYQWARGRPTDWQATDAAAWRHLSTKPLPSESNRVLRNNSRGWINYLNVQGTILTAEHYAVQDRGNGRCRVWAWNDSDDYPDGWKYGYMIDVGPLKPDPERGGALQTDGRGHIYGQDDYMNKRIAMCGVSRSEMLPWSRFPTPPANLIKHGIWTSDELHHESHAKLSPRGWREWTHGVARDQVRNGRVIPQAPQGRYVKPDGTITYFHRDIAQLTHHFVIQENDELEMNLSTATVATMTSGAIGGGVSALSHCFTTPSGEPNNGDWPSGNYRCQLDVNSAGIDLTYGLRAAGSANGHFARADSGLTADQATFDQIEALFDATSLPKTVLATTGTIDPASGSSGDRFECLIAMTRPASHGNQQIALDVNDGDGFADGPWVVGPAPTFQPGEKGPGPVF